jgi:protein tyrosine/serine phosphatase
VLDRFGVDQIINLRTRGEDPADLSETRTAARAAGATVTHIPIAARLPNFAQIEDFLFAVRREGVTSLVHCQHGEDRTGMLVAAYRVVVDGWSVRKAMAEMARYRVRTDSSNARFLRKMLHVLRNERAYWLRKTDPNNVWVRGGSHGENLSFSRVTPALATLYIR